MNGRYKRGWHGESHRHYLAAKGIKTKRYNAHKYYYVPTYVAGDMAPIAADGIGTAGAAVVPWIPVVVPLALLYGGVKYAKNRKDKRAKQGKGFFAEKEEYYAKIAYKKGMMGWEDKAGKFHYEEQDALAGDAEYAAEQAEYKQQLAERMAKIARMREEEAEKRDVLADVELCDFEEKDKWKKSAKKRNQDLLREIGKIRNERKGGWKEYHAKKQKDYIKGGRSDGKKDSDYNQKELKMGRKVEMEHTKNPKIANEIAKDHLEEIPDYYTRLKKMEAKAGVYDTGNERRSGLFGPAKNAKLAKVVTIKSPGAFKQSIATLKGKDGKVSGTQKKALVLARTRAAMQLRRENLKPETRKKFKAISQMELPEVR